MVSVDCVATALIICHNDVLLFATREPQVVLEFWELLLMLDYEVIDVDNLLSMLASEERPVGLFHRVVRGQQEDLVGRRGQRRQVLLIPLEDLDDFTRETGIEAEASEGFGFVLDRCLAEVFVIKVVKSAVVLLCDVAKPVERLDAPIRMVSGWGAYCLLRCLSTESGRTTFDSTSQFSIISI